MSELNSTLGAIITHILGALNDIVENINKLASSILRKRTVRIVFILCVLWPASFPLALFVYNGTFWKFTCIQWYILESWYN